MTIQKKWKEKKNSQNNNSIDFEKENENNKDNKKLNSFDNKIIMINKNDNYIINNNNNIKEKDENQIEINRQQLIQNIKNDIKYNNNIIPQYMKRNYSNKYMVKSLQRKEYIPIKESNNKQNINNIIINSKNDNKNAEVITP